MSELKADLATLQLDDTPDKSRKGLWIALGMIVLAAGAALYAWRNASSFSATEVATATPVVEQAGGAPAGTAILTASGYLVARREAIVSSKIQGRLSELRVEEGSEVKTGDVLARLESADYEAQLGRARAQLQQSDASLVSADAAIRRAEADLAESQRQFGVNQRLAADKLVPIDTLDASRSRVRLSEAALAQSRADRARADAAVTQSKADVSLALAQLQNTVIRAPFSGTVVKKMAEIGESVAPIPPGVNISTASGAIVALADLATLEMEADVSEANVARLSENQPAEVSVEAFPDRKYKAVLRQIIPTADRTKATVLTKVTLIEKDKDLEAGDERQGDVPRAAAGLHGGRGAGGPAHDPGAAVGGRLARRRVHGVRDRQRPRRGATRHDRTDPQRPGGRDRRAGRIRAAGRSRPRRSRTGIA